MQANSSEMHLAHLKLKCPPAPCTIFTSSRKKGMKRWRILLVSFAALAVIVFCWVSIRASRQPTFAGKSLNYWLQQYANSGTSDGIGDIDLRGAWIEEEPVAAIRAMGTNAVPSLLKRMFATRSNTAVSRVFYKVVSVFPRSWNLPEPENSGQLQQVAYLALLRLRPPARLALPQIWKVLTDRNSHFHGKALELCGRLQGSPEEIMPPLLFALTNSNSSLARAAIFSLANLGVKGSAAAPILISMLHQHIESDGHSDPELFALREMGTNAGPALPDLQRLFLAQTDIYPKVYFAKAICQIGGNKMEALDFLIGLLNDKTRTNSVTRDIDNLGLAGVNGRRAIPILLEKVNGTNLDISAHAAQALKKVGASSDQFMPRMRSYLKSDDVGTRVGAATEILRLDPANEEAQALLVETIEQSSDAGNLYTAINALVQAGERARNSLVEAHQALNRRIGGTQFPDNNLVLAAKHIAFVMEAQDAAKANNANQ
jgi:HEAT repeat protein